MRWLMVLVVGMGVLIVAGAAVVAVTILHRMGPQATQSAPLVLDEPAGTRIVSVSGLGDRMAVLLQGGGPDRVAIIDLSGTRRLATLRLAR